MPPAEIERTIIELEEEMLAAAEDLRFEYAAKLRDEIRDLGRELDGSRRVADDRLRRRAVSCSRPSTRLPDVCVALDTTEHREAGLPDRPPRLRPGRRRRAPREIADEVEELKRTPAVARETLATAASEQVRAIVEAAEASAAEIQRQAEDEAREIRAEAAAEAAVDPRARDRPGARYVGKVSRVDDA